jgi:hypothetical protein
MTAKEKAKELVNKMNSQMPVKVIPIASTRENQLSCDIDLKGNFKNAVQCALIAVDELIYETKFEFPNIRQRYWIEVKQEIKKL